MCPRAEFPDSVRASACPSTGFGLPGPPEWRLHTFPTSDSSDLRATTHRAWSINRFHLPSVAGWVAKRSDQFHGQGEGGSRRDPKGAGLGVSPAPAQRPDPAPVPGAGPACVAEGNGSAAQPACPAPALPAGVAHAPQCHCFQMAGDSVSLTFLGGQVAGQQGLSGQRPGGTAMPPGAGPDGHFLLADPGRPAAPSPFLCLKGKTFSGTSFTVVLLEAFQ